MEKGPREKGIYSIAIWGLMILGVVMTIVVAGLSMPLQRIIGGSLCVALVSIYGYCFTAHCYNTFIKPAREADEKEAEEFKQNAIMEWDKYPQ